MVVRKTVICFSGGLIFLWCFTQCAAIKCYQCSDSGDHARADCLRGVRGLAKERGEYEELNKTKPFSSMKKFPYLKECDHYIKSGTGEPLYKYCKIEVIQANGGLNAFIRDCSDGTDISSDLNLTRLSYSRKFLRADNQSTCGYSHRHQANICIQICDTDFCNGPTAGQTLSRAHWHVIFIFAALNVYFMKLF